MSDGNDHMSSLTAAKRTTRRIIKQRLRDMAQPVVAEKSILIQDRVSNMEVWKEARAVGVFLSMPHGEAQTDRLVADAFTGGKRVFVPKTVPDSNDMELLEAGSLEDITSFPRTTWGIPEPDLTNPTTGEPRPNAIEGSPPLDAILVPGLGFDVHCGRLGRGKGFYDRYLSRLSERTGKMPALIALAFECQVSDELRRGSVLWPWASQVLDEVPTTKDDIPVNYLVTEERIVEGRGYPA